ncbi:MAG: response regulator transcription factor [Gammaproteobacteria bacterium]|nr:response regulator transcription factor [Gammaproteobacteria bacterium]
MRINLQDLDCDATIAGNGIEGLDAFKEKQFDLVILDLMLPGMDGLSVCREMRKAVAYVPILVLTAKSTELDRVVGLEMGADDYLTKPFSILELMARIKALFRRVDALSSNTTERKEAKQLIEHASLRIDIQRHEVSIDDVPVELTAREFDLLVHFARHPGRVFSRVQLLDAVWGYSHEGYEHTVNTHINRLRTKIEKDPSKPRYIQTVWGVGYKFAD